MCLIIYSPNGHIPKAHMKRGLKVNPDGWGYAWIEKGQMQTRHGLSYRDFWLSWKWDKPSGPVLWHSRIGTQGTLDVSNCHPFPIPRHDGLVMAHNGIINRCTVKDCEVSDTRLFIWKILQHLPKGFWEKKVYVQRLLPAYIGWSKLVFLHVSGEASIVNERDGYWHAGNWYSNSSWMKPKKEKQTTVFISARDYSAVSEFVPAGVPLPQKPRQEVALEWLRTQYESRKGCNPPTNCR